MQYPIFQVMYMVLTVQVPLTLHEYFVRQTQFFLEQMLKIAYFPVLPSTRQGTDTVQFGSWQCKYVHHSAVMYSADGTSHSSTLPCH